MPATRLRLLASPDSTGSKTGVLLLRLLTVGFKELFGALVVRGDPGLVIDVRLPEPSENIGTLTAPRPTRGRVLIPLATITSNG